MYNKKGAMPSMEIRGLLTFVFTAAIILLLYYGCGVSREKQNYTKFELAKDEIEAIKALNFFLEMPNPTNPEKTVMDLVVESYFSGDYADFNTLAVDHFQEKYDDWMLIVYDKDGVEKYDSCNYHPDNPPCYYRLVISSYAEIYVPTERIAIILDLGEKEN